MVAAESKQERFGSTPEVEAKPLRIFRVKKNSASLDLVINDSFVAKTNPPV